MGCKFWHRHGLLTRIVATLLVAVAITSCFPPSPAEAVFGLDVLIALIIIMICEKAANKLLSKIEDEAEASLEAVVKQILYEGLRIDQQRNEFNLEKKLYGLDHKALPGGDVYFGDISARVKAVFEGSYRSDGKKFTEAWSDAGFEAAVPGYRNTSFIYAREYEKLLEGIMEDYAPGFAASNHLSAAGVTDTSARTSAAAAIMMGNILIKTGEFTEGGYRQLIQATNQMEALSAQHLSQIRTDSVRMNDSIARFAANETQEYADRQAAFEQAVGTWTTPAAAVGW
jgi:hypothetical protein